MKPPRQLVLVDLDNLHKRIDGALPQPSVRPDLSDKWLESSGDAPEAEPDRAPVVVVFAMNLNTADNDHHEYPKLAAFAERLARVLGRGELLGLEIALTLPIPESADAALERLLFHAPSGPHAGRVTSVYLLSEDQGIQRAVDRQMGDRYDDPRLRDTKSHAWHFRGNKNKERRRQPPRSRPKLVVDPTQPEAPWCAIDTAELVQWASSQLVQVPNERSLRSVVAAVRRRPGLLSQVGLTKSSVIGVSRHDGIATGTLPSLAGCSKDDGLEICDQDVRGGVYEAHEPSPLGPGAIRLVSPRFSTVRTLLPPVSLDAVTEPVRVRHNAMLDDNTGLQRMDDQILSQRSFDVRFYLQGRDLVAEINAAFGSSPAAWWRRKLETTAKVRARGVRLPRPITASAVLERNNVGDERGLSVRTPMRGRRAIELETDLAPGQIGAATLNDQQLAVLAPSALPCRAGSISCRAIQDLDDGALRSLYPSLRNVLATLRTMPLVVPA